MTDLTFAFFLLSLGLALSLVIGWMARCSQRLVAPANPSRHWQWSGRLNQTGWLILLVSNALLWTGALLGTLRLVPIALGGGSVLAGCIGILLACSTDHQRIAVAIAFTDWLAPTEPSSGSGHQPTLTAAPHSGVRPAAAAVCGSAVVLPR